MKHTSMAKYLGSDDAEPGFRCEVSLLIFNGAEPGPFGIGVADLLHGVRQFGSLYKAAENMSMAYSKAWKVVNHIEDYLGFQMIIRQVGRGCGSSLTVKGQEFLERYDALLEEMREKATEAFDQHFGDFEKGQPRKCHRS